MAVRITSVLVDTHLILFARVGPRRLTAGERSRVEEADIRYVSMASLWEIAILLRLGRIPGDDQLISVPEGFELLPIRIDHCKTAAALPQYHRDPFDRMLVAQAQSEQVPLLTRDRAIEAYRDHATILRYPDA